MGYVINKPSPKPTPAPQQESVPANSSGGFQIIKKSNPAPPNSTNAQYGMRDVPEEERNKVMTQEEYNRKLAEGELLFGPVPPFPTIQAIDDVKFDFCDGLRVCIPKAKEGEAKRTYHIFIKEQEYNTVVCSVIKTNENMEYFNTVQKYFLRFTLIVTRKGELPSDMRDSFIQKYNLTPIEVAFIHELTQAPDIEFSAVENEIFNKFLVAEADKPRYARCAQEIMNFNLKVNIFKHRFDATDKEVMVQFPVGTIGDSVGWFSYMERFQQQNNCKLICVMNPAIYCLFEKQYPTIKFIRASETKNYQPYASYNMGLYFKANTNNQPYDFRYIGNGRTVSKILDVNDADIPPRVDLSAPRRIKEPYVCIAVQGSAYCKLWTHPQGWHTVIDHLKMIGYRIICIDKDRVTGSGVVTNHIPWGVEDDTGNKPLQERIDLLKDCDFFIGLSSGVSWLAWCAKCPVVMISGFTNPFNEFYTPYRVINTIFCHGCWNDETCDFDHYDYMWCPKHKGTEQAYQCSKNITPEQVLNVIAKIPAYQRMKATYDAGHPKHDPYLLAPISQAEPQAEALQSSIQIININDQGDNHGGTDPTESNVQLSTPADAAPAATASAGFSHW